MTATARMTRPALDAFDAQVVAKLTAEIAAQLPGINRPPVRLSDVVVDTYWFEVTYQHTPRGRGSWAFSFNSRDALPLFVQGSHTYAYAKRLAVRAAADLGVDFIAVCT